jgi:tetratricopeptide (TPR) repeat protein
LPSLSAIVPPPLAFSKIEDAIAATPPDTAAALRAISRRELSDPRHRLAFAVALAEAGLIHEAIDQYATLARLWPRQPRLKRLILDLRQSMPTREIVHPAPVGPAPARAAGKTYALIIGINAYEQVGIPSLLFAVKDAKEFAKFSATERGGKAEVVTLLNEDARASNIRKAIKELMAKLGKDDTFVLFVAAHGDMRGDMPIIVTYRANLQETGVNGVPLSEIQKLRHGLKAPFKQVRVFLDICHGGRIALLEPAPPRRRPAAAPPPPPADALFFTATHQGPDALAYEDATFGHGVFSYFLLRGLATGEARQSLNDRYITAAALSDFLNTWVQKATTSNRDGKPRQKPHAVIGTGLAHELADLQLAGPEFTDTRPLASLTIPDERLGKLRRQWVARKQPAPGAGEAARAEAPDSDPQVALEDEGEDILLRYLEGDETPQERGDFARCARVFSDALALEPGSAYLEARKEFCEGRVSVFDKQYDDAIVHLEHSILLDPTAAYPYNALGIAYLEKGDFATSRLAFEDAVNRAPAWAYPRHNLALTHVQAGDYEAAIAEYREAMRRAPEYFYLPYNLGLLFQRMNRLEEAEAEHRAAIRNAERYPPGRSEPYIALGLVRASRGKVAQAEEYYRKALTIPAAELSTRTARHNLAALLARDDKYSAEARRLWLENGSYVPSQLALAQMYAASNKAAEAITIYRGLLRDVPDHLSGRLQLAAELAKTGDRDGAISELRVAASQQPGNAAIQERLGALLEAAGKHVDALTAYRSALDNAPDRGARARIGSALKRLERAR